MRIPQAGRLPLAGGVLLTWRAHVIAVLPICSSVLWDESTNRPHLTRLNGDLILGEKNPPAGCARVRWGGFCRGLDAAGRGPNPGSGRRQRGRNPRALGGVHRKPRLSVDPEGLR